MSEIETEKNLNEASEQEVSQSTKSKKKSNIRFYIGAVLLVGVVLLIVLYQLEKEGRSSTSIFEGILSAQEANEVVVTVNGSEITNRELAVSIEQFTQMAASQGVDISNESIQSEIRDQAIEVLVNTELLKLEAAERGISITDEEVNARFEAIKTEIGGDGVLEERMDSLGINNEQLLVDINEELLIQDLLDAVFAESDISVSEEEVEAVYAGAGGGEEGVPPLEAVRPEVESQIRAAKEQEVIDALIAELRVDADIQANE